jgi:hypothetical protein
MPRSGDAIGLAAIVAAAIESPAIDFAANEFAPSRQKVAFSPAVAPALKVAPAPAIPKPRLLE